MIHIPYGRLFWMAAVLVGGTMVPLSGVPSPVPAPYQDTKGESGHMAAPYQDAKGESGHMAAPYQDAKGESGHMAVPYQDAGVETGHVAVTLSESDEALQPPAFSHSSGFYQEGFHLTLTTGEPGAVIYYTLDGSMPDPEAAEGTTYRYKNSWPMEPGSSLGEFLTGAFHTYIYTEPLPVTERSSDPDSLTHKATAYNTNYYFPDSPVFKGTIIRARTIKEGFEPSQTITQVYFIHPEGRSRYHLPVISISINENHLFDYEKGIYTPGEVFDDWRLNHPHDHANGSRPANYHRRGEEWEYPAHFTFFDTHSTRPDLSQEVGVRIHGAWTRSYPMKSLRIYARNAYGTSTLDFPFFQNYPHNSFKRLIIRNSGNDWATTMFRDAMIQEVIRPLNLETQAHQPAVLFINGEYWGIHNIRERYDKHYLYRVFGVEEEKLDLLTHNGMIQEGGRVHYINTLNYIRDNDMASDAHFRIVRNRIDMENFIDYQVANIFAANTDWPGNNIDFWRKQTFTYEPDSPYGHDGRWRWLVYDMDFGFGLVGHGPDHHTLAFATEAGNTDWPNPDWSTFLLRNLLRNEQFRHDFINRFADLLNTRFQTDSVLAIIDAHQRGVEPQMPEHIHRWKQPPNMGNWNQNVATLRHFASNRPEWQRQQLQSFFELPGYATVGLNVSGHDHGFIRLNTLELHFEPGGTGQGPVPWTGRYFQNVPIQLEAIPLAGYVFSHWEGVSDADSALIIRDPSELGNLTAHFVEKETMHLVHYWYFDTSLPNDHPMEFIDPAYSITGQARLNFYSALEGYPFDEESPFWRKASMERRNMPTPLNYQPRGNAMQHYDEADMRGIQVRQPFTGDGGENILELALPTGGFKDVVMRFAAMDEGAAEELFIEYLAGKKQGTESGPALDVSHRGDPAKEGLHWIPLTPPEGGWRLSPVYQLFEADFTGVEAADDNPDFMVRILFGSEDRQEEEGGRVSFNNFSLEGWPLGDAPLPPVVVQNPGLQKLIENGSTLLFELHNLIETTGDDPLIFSVTSSMPEQLEVMVEDQQLVLTPLRRGDALVSIVASDGIHDPVKLDFRVLIYPKAFDFAEGDFFFGSWADSEPEHSHPPHMLFLQSDESDPGPDAPLLFPYFVPHDDYHEDDLGSTGLPYALTRRTRINALGDQGVSFINTGRERDLGGALLALRTTGVSQLQLEWLAATILRNARTYSIRLQYRIGTQGAFSDLMIDGSLMEYIAGADGDDRQMGPVSLPPELLGQEYLQLLWRYAHHAGESGPRSELRLDDIAAGPTVNVPERLGTEPRIYAYDRHIYVESRESGPLWVRVYSITGQEIHAVRLVGPGRHRLGPQFPAGIFIVGMASGSAAAATKVVIP